MFVRPTQKDRQLFMGLMKYLPRQQNGNAEIVSSLSATRAPQMLMGNILVQFVGSLFFLLRVYSRLAIIKIWRVDDYMLALAWLFATSYSICQYGQIAHGAGRHAIAIVNDNPQNPVISQKYAYAAQMIVFPALSIPKLSVCLSYLRIFYTDVRGRRMIQFLMVLLVLLIIPFVIEVIFQCSPISAYWTEGRPNSKCKADLAAYLLSGSLNVLVDIALMAIVLPRVLELQLHERQRWVLVFIVLLGSLAVVAGIVRMVRIGTLLNDPLFEPSWDAYDVSIWTSTEIYVSVVCAAAPGVKPVIAKILPKLLGSSLRSRTRTVGAIGPSYELGSKWKRTTISSTKITRQTSETALATVDGPYTECGRGMDSESLPDQTDEGLSRRGSGQEGGIYKTSRISVQTTPR